MTGHGNVFNAEISNLNKYMVAGGFLHMTIMEWTTSEKK
jgi:hypothetical protein